ncbi:uncharacterized protein LOC106071130 isoform X1 [Biomphalaria glabrata]|uniref:Uncharacterized protein LOC106071130 isoform X1 n=2 Tax=Biomphalaria glabrata TaxID=6526 RepID=A0A9W2Z9U2_BIOGL|nr:uncharacterized protein LOC106071130 isoform X1 [Biomphalaria glabrata]
MPYAFGENLSFIIYFGSFRESRTKMSKMSSVTLLALVLSAVLYETVSACTVCTALSGSGTCDTYTSYITCLKAMLSNSGCSSLQLTGIDAAVAAAESALKLLSCEDTSVAGNGTTTATTSMLLLLTLPLLTYILSRN